MARPKLRVAEFIDNGQRYVVRDVRLVEQGDSHLINDCMEFQIDLAGRCAARYLQPNSSTYSQNLRCFFVRDDASGEFWSVPFDPVQRRPDSFEFSAGLADIQWRVTVGDIEAQVRVVVPRNDPVELWTLRLRNLGSRKRRLSLYPCFPVGLTTWITQIARYDPKLRGIVIEHFPYYVKVEDYDKLRSRKNWIFCVADRKPVAAETNYREFLGGNGPHDPAELHLEKLAGGEAHLEPAVMAMQYSLSLAPTKSSTINLAFGPAQSREDIGKITQKTPGTCENGSVYCHAATFYAYGLYRVRQAEEGFRVLRMLLTGGGSNPLSRSQQLPLYIPNFYRGVACGSTAGRGSTLWGTGTAAWYYRTVVNELLGVRGRYDGLEIDPQLPQAWQNAAVWRRFRGAEFNVNIQRSAKVDQLRVTLDGKAIQGNVIPLQKAGTKHTVEVLVPLAR